MDIPRPKARPPQKATAAMLALSLVGLGSVAERTVEDQAVSSAHRQLGKKDKGPCIPNWQQCNTPNVNSGSTECCSDGATAYSCQAITETFSQCKPGAPPPSRRSSLRKQISLSRCVLVFYVHVTFSQPCWCSKDLTNILPLAQCALLEVLAGRGLDWGLRTSHPLSARVSIPPAPLVG